MIKAFQRFEAWATKLAFWGAMVGLLLMTLAAFFQVVTRFVLGDPSTWSEVAARSVMIWSVFLGIAAAFRAGAMIAVDFFVQLTPPKLRILMHTAITIFSALLLALLVWEGILMSGRVANQKLAGLDFSIAWVYAALPVGAAFGLLALISRWIDLVRDHRAGRYDLPVEEAGL